MAFYTSERRRKTKTYLNSIEIQDETHNLYYLGDETKLALTNEYCQTLYSQSIFQRVKNKRSFRSLDKLIEKEVSKIFLKMNHEGLALRYYATIKIKALNYLFRYDEIDGCERCLDNGALAWSEKFGYTSADKNLFFPEHWDFWGKQVIRKQKGWIDLYNERVRKQIPKEVIIGAKIEGVIRVLHTMLAAPNITDENFIFDKFAVNIRHIIDDTASAIETYDKYVSPTYVAPSRKEYTNHIAYLEQQIDNVLHDLFKLIIRLGTKKNNKEIKNNKNDRKLCFYTPTIDSSSSKVSRIIMPIFRLTYNVLETTQEISLLLINTYSQWFVRAIFDMSNCLPKYSGQSIYFVHAVNFDDYAPIDKSMCGRARALQCFYGPNSIQIPTETMRVDVCDEFSIDLHNGFMTLLKYLTLQQDLANISEINNKLKDIDTYATIHKSISYIHVKTKEE